MKGAQSAPAYLQGALFTLCCCSRGGEVDSGGLR